MLNPQLYRPGACLQYTREACAALLDSRYEAPQGFANIRRKMHGGRCIEKLNACMFHVHLLHLMVVLAGELDDVFQVIQALLRCAPASFAPVICVCATCTPSRRVINVTALCH